MYNNEKTPGVVGKILHTFFILFIIIVIGILGITIVKHIDGDTFTVTSSEAEEEECGDEQAQKAAEKAGLKVPVKCQKKSK